MRVAIFTPTCRPGIDVSLYSILRQDTDADLFWIIGDQLYPERCHLIQNHLPQYSEKFDYSHFYTPIDAGNPRNLAKTYNIAIDYAREYGADIFISMQDYIYVPPQGVERFVQDSLRYNEKVLFSGLCSISADPDPNEVWDNEGMASIFREWYDKRPESIAWVDPRSNKETPSGIAPISPIEWETNWACIGKHALYDETLYFDERYDSGVAYENQDYAYRARQRGYDLLLDSHNHAISLPHKEYFRDEWQREKPLTEINRELSESLWGSP
jgi:hypothetical protein